MNSLLNYKLLESISGEMGGVFTINDLRNLFNIQNNVILNRLLNKFESLNLISRFKNGIYTSSTFDQDVLACRLYPDSYISMGSVLAKKLIIGSVPSKTIYIVKPGRNKEFSGNDLKLKYFGISPDLIFDIEKNGAVRYASAEKAFLDTLYFHQHGVKFSFDIYSDINYSLLDSNKVSVMLEKYSNPRFIAFVKGILENNG